MRLCIVFTAVIFTLASSEVAVAAVSCSSWRATCVKRATAVSPGYLPDCDAKFNACLSSGCFTEGKRFGGGTHCGLTKK
jgi:hypothetical protein